MSGVLGSDDSSGSVAAKREKRVPGLFKNELTGRVGQQVVAAKRQGGGFSVKAVVDIDMANSFEIGWRGVFEKESELNGIKRIENI